jgi:hypothetical protein
MENSSAPPRGMIFTFRDFPGLVAICKFCGQRTTVDMGVASLGCSHIGVKFCDDGEIVTRAGDA